MESWKRPLRRSNGIVPFSFTEMGRPTPIARIVASSRHFLVTGLPRLVGSPSIKEVDRARRAVLRQLKHSIRQDPERVNTWLRLINTARNLERIADHAASIAEAVIDIREGDIVRHAESNFRESWSNQ